jgi:hypothetical protein
LKSESGASLLLGTPIERTVGMPPALEAKVTDHVWTFEELVEMTDQKAIARGEQPTTPG